MSAEAVFEVIPAIDLLGDDLGLGRIGDLHLDLCHGAEAIHRPGALEELQVREDKPLLDRVR